MAFISWDPEKDEEHVEKRGVGFAEVISLLRVRHARLTTSDYPDQIRVIGKLKGAYWTLVIEELEDDYGDLIWCSNFWKSSKQEKQYANSQGIL